MDMAKENSAYFDSSKNLYRKPEQRRHRTYLPFYQGLKLGHEPLDPVAWAQGLGSEPNWGDHVTFSSQSLGVASSHYKQVQNN